ncbi:AAA family ATPase [Deinococcus yavapaiensis]|uniref:Uncharacterized AAA domain-containing protein ycf46 n=1 Tax=Deinococcus yavapaiensis KR-236 TaxID=694435 RepID=A0A318SNJ8_9DEIO|nr:AAA family ATPase [Deinococcus yavapaiensis]PYE54219.1 ATPase family protein associated with various cellular activities (AAA) [Deinococcus yavapaiensis KR-236]
MTLSDALRELKLLVRARYGAIVLDAPHEERTFTLLQALADGEAMPMMTWSLARGLASAARGPVAMRRAGSEGSGVYGTTTLEGALDFMRGNDRPALYVVEGAGRLLEEPLVQAKLHEVVAAFSKSSAAVVLLGDDVALPKTLLPYTARANLPGPGTTELGELVDRTFRELSRTMRLEDTLSEADRARLVANLRGLSFTEAERVVARVILEDGKLCAADVARVMLAKREVVAKDGLLEFMTPDLDLADVAGLTTLKAWLTRRAQLFERPREARAFGLPFPKGVLLLGVPGVGKSLTAKAIAAAWGLPLLRLDAGRLFDKYVGETERNFREAIRTAQRTAPVVLWIDEIEKAFASGGESDGGASRRMLGAFLSWLQDRDGDVFVAATANDVSALPPELVRKGRFDEVFFLDLPDFEARRAILALQVRKRGHDAKAIHLDLLADATEGFSGAELEAAVVSALYAAFASGERLSTATLLGEFKATRPLSVLRAENVAALRAWAAERAVSAN